jgi:CubicO group peptidase (beta-lactamase class C family)
MTLSNNIQSILDSVVTDPTTDVPGIAFVAVNKNGTVLTQNAAGKRGLSSDEPFTPDTTILWLASCTKLITAIAVMQLVEQGKLELDDAQQVRINMSRSKCTC